MNRRIFILLLLLIIYLVVIFLSKYGHLPIPDSFVKGSQVILIALILLLIANIVIKFTENRVFRFFRDEIDIEQRIFITKIYKTLIHIIVIAIIMSRLGLSVNSITLFIGFIATGLALALKDILISYFVWFIIIAKKPFRIGDYIVHGEVKGTIVRIGTFFTTLSIKRDSPDNNIIKLPNKILLDKPIIDYGSGNEIVQNVKIRLKSLPENLDKTFSHLKASLKKALGGEDPIDVYLDMENNEIILIVSFNVMIDNKFQIQSKVIACLYSMMKNHIK